MTVNKNSWLSIVSLLFLAACNDESTPIPVNNGFAEYNIPLSDFKGLDLENISIPFSIWNPKDSEENYFEGEILIDNLYFSN